MNIIIENNNVSFGIKIPIDQIYNLANVHFTTIPNTRNIEVSAITLIQSGFPDDLIQNFVRSVCRWGNYEGLAGRILRRNSLNEIRNAFIEAIERLSIIPIDFSGALASINRLDGLGTPSFASKHLRFLNPKNCPVYDSILDESLPYSFDPQGYARFAQDCSLLADELMRLNVPNPFLERNGNWYVADVEAALFIFIKDYNGIA